MISSNFQGDEPGVHDRAKGDVDHVRPGRPRQHRDGRHPSPAWAQVVMINMVNPVSPRKIYENEIVNIIHLTIIIILCHGGGSKHGHSQH